MGTILWPSSMTSLDWALFWVIYAPLAALTLSLLHWLRELL